MFLYPMPRYFYQRPDNTANAQFPLPQLPRLPHCHNRPNAPTNPDQVTLQSDHPLKGQQLSGQYRLHLPGAAQLTIQIDARSERDRSSNPNPNPNTNPNPNPNPKPHPNPNQELDGSACLRFCTDEAGRFEVARFEGVAAGRWQNVTAPGDTVWVHATGETGEKKSKRKLWGFRVRITAEGWMPPEAEAQTLDTPLPIGWQLLELLCEHRPTELLTNHTYLVLTKYVHTARVGLG